MFQEYIARVYVYVVISFVLRSIIKKIEILTFKFFAKVYNYCEERVRRTKVPDIHNMNLDRSMQQQITWTPEVYA